jgi:hypothetical protein
LQSVDGKKTRLWIGIKLQGNIQDTKDASKGSLTLKKSSKSVKSKKEDVKKRPMRPTKKLEEMFKK